MDKKVKKIIAEELVKVAKDLVAFNFTLPKTAGRIIDKRTREFVAKELMALEIDLKEAIKGNKQSLEYYKRHVKLLQQGKPVPEEDKHLSLEKAKNRIKMLTELIAELERDVKEQSKVKTSGCEKLPEGGMRDNCEKKVEEGKKKESKTIVAGHHKEGNKWYVDTSFINTIQRVYPNSSLEHMGFGEFYLETPDGNLEFDRMRGKDFDGQSGRSHLLYDNAGGKVVKKAIQLMERSGKSKEASSSDKVIKDIYNLSSGTMGTLTGIKQYAKLDKIQKEFGEFAESSSKNYKTWSEAWDDFAKKNKIKVS
jgi:hypothetical protein